MRFVGKDSYGFLPTCFFFKVLDSRKSRNNNVIARNAKHFVAIQQDNNTFGKECPRDFKGCARHTSADRIQNSSSEVREASPLKSPTKRSQITPLHNLTPPPNPLQTHFTFWEGEVIDSAGLRPNPHLLFAKQKVSKKIDSHEALASATARSVVGEGERLRGGGSDFAIQAPPPLTKMRTRGDSSESGNWRNGDSFGESIIKNPKIPRNCTFKIEVKDKPTHKAGKP